MTNTENLKYLFEAQFTDNTIYKQTLDDKSNLDPKKRSAYYDVQEEVKKGKTIRMFSLKGDGNIISVDLGTGLFYINGLKVLLESEKLPQLPDKFTLIFYRQWTMSVNQDYRKTKEGLMKFVSQTPRGEKFCEYFIGWQCLVGKKNYQQKIAVS